MTSTNLAVIVIELGIAGVILLFTLWWLRITARARTLIMTQVRISGEISSAVERGIGRVSESLRQLRSAEREVVVSALQEVLNQSDIEELPKLKELSQNGTPLHHNTPLVIAAMQARVPVWMWGDAGSGKTKAAAIAARKLGLPFRFISVCPATTKSEFLGYRDASGQYRSTAFREIYENGGVFLIDEIDNGNPSILSVLNTALANDHCAFPDSNIARHPDAIFVAAANTIGRGADVMYIGRNALDVTTLDRFVFVRMDIDEELEGALMGQTWDKDSLVDISAGGSVSADNWLNFVRSVRHACHELGLEHLVSPRASIYGRRLAELGVGKTHLEEMCIWKGLRETDKHKLQAQASIAA